MLKYQRIVVCLSAICVTHIATDTSSTYADRGADRYYNYRVVNPSQDKVNLKVYYESLCPDCIQFDTGPLDDVLRKIGSYLKFKSYPYGNARMEQQNGKTVVICQHGDDECYGNKLHACAIDRLQHPIWAGLYNSCMMASHWGGKGSTDMDASRCGASMGIKARSIISCAKSQKGEDLLEYYGRQTALVPNRTYVPYVIINGKVFDGEFADFKAAVCRAFASPPAPCLQ